MYSNLATLDDDMFIIDSPWGLVPLSRRSPASITRARSTFPHGTTAETRQETELGGRGAWNWEGRIYLLHAESRSSITRPCLARRSRPRWVDCSWCCHRPARGRDSGFPSHHGGSCGPFLQRLPATPYSPSPQFSTLTRYFLCTLWLFRFILVCVETVSWEPYR